MKTSATAARLYEAMHAALIGFTALIGEVTWDSPDVGAHGELMAHRGSVPRTKTRQIN